MRESQTKLRRFQAGLRKSGIDFAIISSWSRLDINQLYFLGSNIKHTFLLIPKKGNSIFVVPRFEAERAKREVRAKVLVISKNPLKQIKKIAGRFKAKKIGLNLSFVSVSEYRQIKKILKRKIFDISTLLVQTRMIKDSDEIKTLRHACGLTDKIMHRVITNFSTFKTEQEVADFIARQAMAYGCHLSFDTIVASGGAGSMPHYKPGGRLRKGFCVIDFGIKYKGYCTDITRTLYLGNPKKEEIMLYNLLLDAQKNAINMIEPGMKCSVPYFFVKKSLGKYNKNFTHALGHGIGVQIHELPNLSKNSKEKFTEGMVFTVEPGLYFKGNCGMRIEDDVFIQNGRPVVLTKSQKKLITVSIKNKKDRSTINA
ncbi:MAG: Xaa-Pro peptidase family protein [Candidatus Woesearchaeota archaeon]